MTIFFISKYSIGSFSNQFIFFPWHLILFVWFPPPPFFFSSLITLNLPISSLLQIFWLPQVLDAKNSSLCLLILNHGEYILICFTIFLLWAHQWNLSSLEYPIWPGLWKCCILLELFCIFFLSQMTHRYLWLNFYVKSSVFGFLYHVSSMTLDSKRFHGKAWGFDFLCKTFLSMMISGQWVGFL